MSRFVGKERVAVTLEEVNPDTGAVETNTVWVRAKMGWGARQRVKGVIFDDIHQAESGEVVAQVNFGKASVQLLKENILDWSGPAFENERGKKIPVSSGAIDDLDSDWELVDMVLEKINDLNRSVVDEEEQIKNLPTNGSRPSTDDILVPLEATSSTSTS